MDILSKYKKDIKKIKNPTQVEMCLPLVIKIATRYQTNGIDIIDLIQEGNLGLLSAWETFDYERGVKFSTYAYSWIKKRIIAFVENEIGISSFKNKFKKLINKEDPSLLILEYELEEEMIRKDLIYKFKQTLTTRDRDIFKSVLEDGDTLREAADKFKVSHVAIHKAKESIINRFKDFYNKE